MTSILVRRAANQTGWCTNIRNILLSALTLGDVVLRALRKAAHSDDCHLPRQLTVPRLPFVSQF